jgi:acyl-CoA reductase-like NAD-dependent aldehyde dehydrogenase
MGHCEYFLSKVDKFMADVYFDDYLLFTPSSQRIRYEPLGVALIFGSWNYPYYVTLKPLITCIAAGNCALVKPSELGTKSQLAIKRLVEKYLDNRCYRVVVGGVEVS